MTPPDMPSVLQAVGYAFVGVLTYLGVRITSRESRKATDGATAVTGFDLLTGRLEKRLEDVETEVADLKRDLRRSERIIQLAVAYISDLLAHIARITGERDPAPPSPPEELTEHLPPWLVPRPREDPHG